MQMVQTAPQNRVNRSRFFSTTEDPDSDEETEPPNIDDRPPPLPRCSRMRSTSNALEMMSTMDRPRIIAGTAPFRVGGGERDSLLDAQRRQIVAAVRRLDVGVAQPGAADQHRPVLHQRRVRRGLHGDL